MDVALEYGAKGFSMSYFTTPASNLNDIVKNNNRRLVMFEKFNVPYSLEMLLML